MSYRLKFSTILGIIFCLILGVVLNFSFKWLMSNPIAASFSAVNESVWEQLKLTFFPVLLYSIFEYFSEGHHLPGYLYARSMAVLSALAFMVVSCYTIRGIIGRDYIALDIILFVASILLTFGLTFKIQKHRRMFSRRTGMAIFIFLLLTAGFVVFTYYPPHIGLFKDPSSSDYGILPVIRYLRAWQ